MTRQGNVQWDAKFWDDRYQEFDEQMWSGEPNGALVAEVAALPPGRALDLGCGEGGDALWLAAHGWQVTATDISQVALDRAARVAGAAAVTWTRTDVAVTPPAAGAYDLVSAQYFPILRQPGHETMRGVLAAVAPGGTLLFVGHDLIGHEEHIDFDPKAFYEPAEVATLLADGWTIEVNETRPRPHTPNGNPHVNDIILRARRTG
jgi:SAM-dependent methyltransferase